MSQQPALPRASTFAVPSSQRGIGGSAGAGVSARPHGAYNSRRDVPPPSVGTSSFTSSHGGGGVGSSSGLVGPVGGPGVRATRDGASSLLTKAVVMVDEATEPGISDEEGVRRRVALVELVQSGGDPRHGSVGGNSPGAAVAHAMRKRLKSNDHVAVLNCLTLLDETMRYCPYFYRYVANEKFFRRLWRFVDPEYKPDPRGRLPFSTTNKLTKMVAASRTSAVNIELAERVLILLRAWAEELSIMFSGQQEPDAGFFIERYSAKRTRIKFPELPPSSVPWVCPVGTTAGRSRFASYGDRNGRRGTTTTTKSPLPKSLSLGEIENTVNLFSNLLEKANDISEVRGDLCTDLADRCRLISQHIDTLSATMEKEEELARAIKVSEQLQLTLSVYDAAIATGELAKGPVVVVDGLSSDGNSVDEGYDVGPSSYPPVSAYNGDRGVRGDEGSSRRRDASAGSSSSTAQDRRRSMDSDDYGADRGSGSARERPSTRKREKKEAVKLSGSPSKSSVKSSKSSTKKESSKLAAAKAVEAPASSSLVDVGGPSSARSSSSDSSADDKKDSNAFNILEKRYTSAKSNKSNKSNKSSMTGATPDLSAAQSAMVVPAFAGMSVSGPTAAPPSSHMPQIAHGTPQLPATRAAPQQQQGQEFQPQPQQSQMPYGSVMMMPNPMAMSMYGSYNPAMMQQPQPYGGMPSAYNTINPGMYYNTVNPMAYASVGVAHPNTSNGSLPSAPPMQSQSVPEQVQQLQAQQPKAQQPQAQQTQAQQPHAQQSQAQQSQTQQPPAQQPPQYLQSTMQQVSQTPQSQPQTPQVPHAEVVPQQMTQVQPPTQQQQLAGFGMNVHPVPPPPPMPGAYATVTNAPAPPPQEPPPPVSLGDTASAGASAAAPGGQAAVQNRSFLYASTGQQQLQGVYPGMNAVVANPNAAQYPSMSGVPAMAAPMAVGASPQPNAAQYTSVSGTSAMAPPMAMGANPQAMAYQNAMANAAAAYHAAATAYHSVQGQTPLQPADKTNAIQDSSSLSPNVSQ